MNELLSSGNNGSLSEVRDKTLTLRTSQTPAEQIKTRKGKNGQVWKYIQRIDAMRWLDKNYPGWSFEVVPDSFKEYAGFVCVVGKLTVIETGNVAFHRVVSCVGCDEIEFKKEDKSTPVMITYYKNAETDALKRCTYTLGGFTDVYTDEVMDANEEVCSDNDLEWFMHNAFPVLYDKYKNDILSPRNLMKSVSGFLRGDIPKELIIKALNNLNVS